VDRLGWTVGQTYIAYGVHFGIRSNSPAIMHRLIETLPAGAKESKRHRSDTIFSFLHGGNDSNVHSRIKRFNIIYRNGDIVGKSVGNVDKLIATLESDIHFCIAELAENHFFIHAGVVEWNGRGILIPARSQRGKSTLVRKMIEAGATLYSDEYAVLDSTGRVFPFPRPIHIRDAKGNITRISAAELGARIGNKPITSDLILFSEYNPGAVWSPRPISRGKAILKVLANCVSVRRKPRPLLKVINKVVGPAERVVSPRGEAEEVVEWCRRRIYR